MNPIPLVLTLCHGSKWNYIKLVKSSRGVFKKFLFEQIKLCSFIQNELMNLSKMSSFFFFFSGSLAKGSHTRWIKFISKYTCQLKLRVNVSQLAQNINVNLWGIYMTCINFSQEDAKLWTDDLIFPSCLWCYNRNADIYCYLQEIYHRVVGVVRVNFLSWSMLDNANRPFR